MGKIPVYDYLNENIDYGVSTVGRVLVNAARDVVCSVRNQYPSSFSLLPFDKALGNGLCSEFREDEPVPSPPSFTNGQCDGEPYQVFYYQLESETNNNFSPLKRSNREKAASFITNIEGPVSSVILKSPDGTVRSYGYLKAAGRRFTDGWTYEISHGGPNSPTIYTSRNDWGIEITDFRRSDGGSECGNASASLPPDPPRNLSDFTKQVEICRSDENGDVIDCELIDVTLPQKEAYDFPVCVEVDGRKICYGLDGWSVEDAVEGEEKEEEEKEEEETEEKEVLDGVVIEVTLYPPRGRTYLNETDELVNFYAAYFSWEFKAGNLIVPGEMSAIRRPFTYYKAPDGVEGYATIPVNGAEIKVTEIKKTITVPKAPAGES